MHDGHRERLRNKMDQNALEEHEWLEALLFNAIPRKNTNDIAHRLLAAFGTIPNVFSASYEQLKRVDGVGDNAASYLKCFAHFLHNYEWQDHYEFCFEPQFFRRLIEQTYKNETVEVMDFYFYNAKKQFIYRQRFTCDERNSVNVASDMISDAIVDFKKRGLANAVFVHNHLSGSSDPSEADVEATLQVQMMMSMHNVLLLDHFIYSPSGIYSFYESGRMKEINRNFNMNALLKNSGVLHK